MAQELIFGAARSGHGTNNSVRLSKGLLRFERVIRLLVNVGITGQVAGQGGTRNTSNHSILCNLLQLRLPLDVAITFT